jgi:hypothetical protein
MMMRVCRLTVLSIVGVAAGIVAMSTVAGGDADPAQFTYHAGLNGAKEVPGPGDQNGSGKAVITVDTETGEICYEVAVRNIAPAALAHIHEGPSTVAGPIVVNLEPPTDGSSSACTFSAEAQDIADDPSGYYVNVHNAEFPDGAVRGQLHGRADRH